MLPSLVPATLAAALCSLVVSAEQLPSSIISKQQPLPDHPDLSIPPSQTDNTGRPSPACGVTLRLFAAPSTPNPINADTGCRGSEYKEISLATDTCLSGDYYLSNNLQITKKPICDNGEEAVLSYYQAKGCERRPRYNAERDLKELSEGCLWPGRVPIQWSLVFCCRAEMTSKVLKHAVAVPPPTDESPVSQEEPDNNAPKEEPTDGQIYTHLFPVCNGRRAGGHKLTTLPVDRCLTIHGFGIQFKTPAVCSNGTRAKWARFEDSKCGYGEISAKYGLVDVKDSEHMQCLSTGYDDGEKKVSSMSFWCDGFGDVKRPDPNAPEEPEVPKPAKGSVSESACAGRAPFFNHPKTDTCVEMKTNKLKIYSLGVCPDGKAARLAKFKQSGCGGAPAMPDVSKEKGNLETCLDFTGTKSFALWCDGKGLQGLKPSIPHRSRMSWTARFTILLLTLLVFGALSAVGMWAWSKPDIRERIQGLLRRKESGIAL